MTKGLTDKWTVWVRDPHEQRRVGYFKADYAFDDEGRMWRRTYAPHPSAGRSWAAANWTNRTPWHIADPYVWFPADSLEPPSNARKANSRARLPKTTERYLDERGRATIIVGKD